MNERPDVIPSLRHILKRQYEQGYDSTCDTIEETIVELERLRETVKIQHYETANAMAMFGAAIEQLVKIKSFVHPDGIVVNGIGYSFHPPDLLVREAWEALSKAIRETDVSQLGDGGQNPVVTPTKPPA